MHETRHHFVIDNTVNLYVLWMLLLFYSQLRLSSVILLQIVQRICEPGFLCRSHTIRRSRDQPLQKIDTIYARPVLADDLDSGRKSYTLWTWARQDQERNFSIIDVRKGVFNLPEKQAPGGRVYAMTATGEVEKRIWIGTAVSTCIIHYKPIRVGYNTHKSATMSCCACEGHPAQRGHSMVM